MHYNEAAHSGLVAAKTGTLDHRIRILSDDTALVHFDDKIKNKFVTENSEFNLLESNSFFLGADGLRTEVEDSLVA